MRKILCFVGVFACVTVGWAEERQVALVEAVAPVYPLVAAYTATSGDVKVKLMVDRTGSVTTASIVEGHKLLSAAALDAARRWRFSTSDEGKETTIVFSFRILPKGTSESELAVRFRPPLEIEVRRMVPEATTNSDPAADPQKRKAK
jgi:TonB family protein